MEIFSTHFVSVNFNSASVIYILHGDFDGQLLLVNPGYTE